MGRSSYAVRLARWVQSAPLWLFRFLEWPLVVLLARRSNRTQALFVLALPRSGSTVTYQTICHGLSVNYLSNLWHLFYQLPLLGGWASALIIQRHRSDFRSQHGFVPGLDGPAEGLAFWRYWLGCGLSDSDCDTKPSRQSRASYLRKVLSVLARRHGPFATAYLGHSLMPDRVNNVFPGAVLIRLRREPVSNALSILKSMRASDSGWFSVLPQECEGMKIADQHERVAAQVYWLNRRLDDAYCSGEMLDIHYEQLCKCPAQELERIRNWCLEKGVPVELKYSLPAHFQYKSADLEADADAAKIRQKLNELEEQHGRLEATE